MDFFTEEDEVTLDDFDQFPVLFWKEMWKDKKAEQNPNWDRHSLDNDDYDEFVIPDELEDVSEYTMTEGSAGVLVSSAYQDNIDVEANRILQAIETVKSEAPDGVNIRVTAGGQYN